MFFFTEMIIVGCCNKKKKRKKRFDIKRDADKLHSKSENREHTGIGNFRLFAFIGLDWRRGKKFHSKSTPISQAKIV